jgi:beta-ribofuranosylaminobenzene 5'-phosphate synthase
MRPDEEVSIRIRPRVHLGLISMHEGGPRRNGGIGFSLQEPGAIVTGTPATKFALVDERELGFGENEATQLRATADEAVAADTLSSNVAIRISGGIRTHVGMGSGTAIRLAVLEVIYVINGRPRPREHLIARSARGGTSGIGINTYFDGGLILDLGVKSGPNGFFPSSSIRPATVPTALPRLAMPEWPMCLCLPRSIRPKSQNEELDFFKRTAPVDPAASFRAAYDALFGIYAAVADADHEAFCRAVTSIQHTTWKNAEWREYGVQLERLRDDLACLGADCVGMSSLGPMLFCLGDPTILDEVVRRQDALDCKIVRTVPDNAGRVVLQARHA